MGQGHCRTQVRDSRYMGGRFQGGAMHGRRRTQVSDFSSERGEGRTYLFTHSSAGDQLIVPTGRDQSPSCSQMSQMISSRQNGMGGPGQDCPLPHTCCDQSSTHTSPDTITYLRDPAERALSSWNMVRHRGKALSLKGFKQEVRPISQGLLTAG